MKQIEKKFRVWDNIRKIWHIFTIEDLLNRQIGTYGIESINADWDKTFQWIGLFDKNGVEVYEGDIMEVPFTDIGGTKHKPEIVTIVWDSPVFEFGHTGKVWGGIKDDIKGSEVIGNITENKSLIKNI